jgi:hypothetical protein
LLRRWGAVLKTRPGYGYAFAAGLALGIVLLAAVGPRITGPDAPDQGQLYGTAIPGTATGSPAERAVTIAAADAAGSVQAWFDDNRIVVRVELDTDGPVQVVLAADPGLTCDSFRALEPGNHDLATQAGTTRLTHAGRGVYEITLVGAGARTTPLTVRIHKDGTLLGEEVLAPR